MLSLVFALSSTSQAADPKDVAELIGYMVGQMHGSKPKAERIQLERTDSVVFRQNLVSVAYASCDYNLLYVPKDGKFLGELGITAIQNKSENCWSSGAIVSDFSLDGGVDFGMLSKVDGEMFFTSIVGIHGIDNRSTFQNIFDLAVQTALNWYGGK